MIKRTLLCILLLTAAVWGDPAAHLKQGQKIPIIQEVDQHGVERKLQSIQGKNGTLFVIFRSADW